MTNTNNASGGSLRDAINQANGNRAVLDQIHFNIPGAGVQTISLTSALPLITGPVNINGTAQPGYAGTPLIELSGASLPLNTSGLTLTGAASSGSTIRRLIINRFTGTSSAIRMLSGSANNVVVGNYLRTDAAGTGPAGNGVGVFIQTSGNRVGGLLSAERNVISANTTDGIQITGASATGNLVQGNYIRLDASASPTWATRPTASRSSAAPTTTPSPGPPPARATSSPATATSAWASPRPAPPATWSRGT